MQCVLGGGQGQSSAVSWSLTLHLGYVSKIWRCVLGRNPSHCHGGNSQTRWCTLEVKGDIKLKKESDLTWIAHGIQKKLMGTDGSSGARLAQWLKQRLVCGNRLSEAMGKA